jgi:putative endonuclease
VKQCYVYIPTNASRILYTGVTDNLERRIYEHKNKLVEGFTKRYNITELVYYEGTSDVHSAIMREKHIKGWLRRKKIALIEAMNPNWDDLSAEWAEERYSESAFERTKGV